MLATDPAGSGCERNSFERRPTWTLVIPRNNGKNNIVKGTNTSRQTSTAQSRTPRPQTGPRIPRVVFLIALGLVGFGIAFGLVKLVQHNSTPPGMVWISGGEFTMGTDWERGNAVEKPAHRVRVDGFFMDETDVTNAQFRKFVEATGYVTTAEKPVDAAEILRQSPPGTPPPPKENLLPGSMVFSPTSVPVKILGPQ